MYFCFGLNGKLNFWDPNHSTRRVSEESAVRGLKILWKISSDLKRSQFHWHSSFIPFLNNTQPGFLFLVGISHWTDGVFFFFIVCRSTVFLFFNLYKSELESHAGLRDYFAPLKFSNMLVNVLCFGRCFLCVDFYNIIIFSSLFVAFHKSSTVVICGGKSPWFHTGCWSPISFTCQPEDGMSTLGLTWPNSYFASGWFLNPPVQCSLCTHLEVSWNGDTPKSCI